MKYDLVNNDLDFIGQVEDNKFAYAIVMDGPSINIEELRTRISQLTEANENLIQAATDNNRDIEDQELEQIEQNNTEIEALNRRVSAFERVNAMRTGTGRLTTSNEVAGAGNNGGNNSGSRRTVPASPRPDPRTAGFRHLGDFAMAVHAAANRDEQATNRLLQMNEGVGEDGGFLVPAEFRDSIMQTIQGEDSLLSMCDGSTTNRNAVIQPVDETTPWSTSGIVAYWEGEAQAASASGGKFKTNTLRLNKLFARVDVSDELLDDAPQLDNYLRVKAPEVMTSVINLAIVQGNGVGKPLGIMNSGCLVTVAAATSQPADTIFHQNLIAMMGRMYSKSWPRSTWLMHQDVWAKLPLMSFSDVGKVASSASGTQVPIYVPPGGLSAGPYGTLLGRPIMVLEAMETIGDLGDIILADMNQYRIVTKTQQLRVETSIHLKFDTDEMVYRFIFRLAGAPWWTTTGSHRDGSNTFSPFVTLASR